MYVLSLYNVQIAGQKKHNTITYLSATKSLRLNVYDLKVKMYSFLNLKVFQAVTAC
jgi:hypothetical protein